MNNAWKINHLKRSGYRVTSLGKNIKAEKTGEKHTGKVSNVHKKVFRY
jgi:hypothetical protein